MKNRIIAILLVLSMIFGFTSCEKTEEIPPKDKDLTVEIETVEYDIATIDEAAVRMADIAELFVLMYYGRAISEKDRVNISEIFKEGVYPALSDIKIYKHELYAMMDCIEECLTYSAEDKEENNQEFFFDLYTRWNRILDTDRLGALIFELQIISLEEKLKDKQEKYDKYQYSYLIVDIEYYTDFIARARGLGRERFADALSVITFMSSAFVGIFDADTGNIKLSIGDVFVIMERQSKRFVDLGLADGEWEIVAELCEEFIPTKTSNIRDKVLIALGDDDFFIGLASLMPDVITFYRELTKNISEDTIDIIEGNGDLAYESALCLELMNNKQALMAILDKISEEMPAAGYYSTSALKAYDDKGYSAFLERETCQKDDVILAIEAFTNTPTKEAFDWISNSFKMFIAGVNPVFAYVYLCD